MLCRTIKRLIEGGRTEGLALRVDVLYAAGRLTDDEYAELRTLLPKNAENAT